jgi:hypothetical protein
MTKWGETSLRGILESADIEHGLSRIRRMDLLVNLTQHHRTIWLKFFDAPNLERIFKSEWDNHLITEEETLFVQLILLHLTTILTAVRKGLLVKPADLDADLKTFFWLPIPAITWQRTKVFYDAATRRYIDELIADLNPESVTPKN